MILQTPPKWHYDLRCVRPRKALYHICWRLGFTSFRLATTKNSLSQSWNPVFFPETVSFIFSSQNPMYVFHHHLQDSNDTVFDRWRLELFDCMQSNTSARIVEVGAGGGANFAYYPINSRVTCVEPVMEFSDHLQENMNRCASKFH